MNVSMDAPSGDTLALRELRRLSDAAGLRFEEDVLPWLAGLPRERVARLDNFFLEGAEPPSRPTREALRARLRDRVDSLARRRLPQRYVQGEAIPEELVRRAHDAEAVVSSKRLKQAYLRRFGLWITDQVPRGAAEEVEYELPKQCMVLTRFNVARDPVMQHERWRANQYLDVLLFLQEGRFYFFCTDLVQGMPALLAEKKVTIALTRENLLCELPHAEPHAEDQVVDADAVARYATIPFLNQIDYPSGVPAEMVAANQKWNGDKRGVWAGLPLQAYIESITPQ